MVLGLLVQLEELDLLEGHAVVVVDEVLAVDHHPVLVGGHEDAQVEGAALPEREVGLVLLLVHPLPSVRVPHHLVLRGAGVEVECNVTLRVVTILEVQREPAISNWYKIAIVYFVFFHMFLQVLLEIKLGGRKFFLRSSENWSVIGNRGRRKCFI